MAAPDTWRTAHLKQARSDIAVFYAINRQPICQQLHYLQMGAEMVAKAYLSSQGGKDEKPLEVHRVLTRFVRACRGDASVRGACKVHAASFRSYIDGLLVMAHSIEGLVPQKGIEKPNPEYPWKDKKSGKVIAPVDYPFAEHQFDRAKLGKLLQFVRVCANMD
jgi:hypothetical protein